MKPHLLLAARDLSAAALGVATVSGQCSMTVSQDRLVNAQNEPQNWLMMNGDYGSIALFEADADQPRHRQEPPAGLGAWRSAACRTSDRTVRRAEIHPLVDNGFLYTSDGWGTLYKIDGRNPNKGEFVWVTDPGVKHQGNLPRTRGIALWEDLVIANLPDGRVIAVNRDTGEIVWDKMVAATNEFGSQERFNAAPIAADGKGDRRQRRGRREDARLDRGARRAIGQGAVALVRRAEAGRSRQRNLEGHEQRVEDRRRRPLADRFLRPRDQAHDLGHRQSGADLRSAGASRRQPLHQLRRRAERRHRQAGLVLPVHAERFLGLRRSRRPHAVRRDASTAAAARSSAISRATASTTRSIAPTANSCMGGQYVNDLNWTKGLNPRTGKPLDYDPKLDVQIYNPAARALRGDPSQAQLSDLARRHRAPADRLQPGEAHRLRRRHRGLLRRETARRSRTCRPKAGSTRRSSEKRTYSSDLYYGSITAFDTVNHKVRRQGGDRHRDSLGRDRHRRRPGVHGVAGRLGRRLQRRDARGALALQRRHTAQGRAGDLRHRAEAVSGRAVGRPPSAPGEVRQAGELELPVRLRAELVRRLVYVS